MPISITLSLCFILVAYFGVAGISTLMWPYYDQNKPAPLSYIFDQVGWPVAKYIVAVGAITSLSTALLGSMFPLPRVLYAMSNDGLIFNIFSRVSKTTQTPLIATIFAGLFAGTMAALFDVQQLADMMSIGTLLAYTLVVISVLILRYQEDHIQVGGVSRQPSQVIIEEGHQSADYGTSSSDSNPIVMRNASGLSMRKLLNINWIHSAPNIFTAKLSNILIALICICAIIMDTLLVVLEDQLFNGDPLAVALSLSSFFILIFVAYLLSLQPQTTLVLPFKVITVHI